MKGAREPPRVLKPQDFDQMNRNTGNTWKPQIGFTPSTQVATLSEAGRRILGWVATQSIHLLIYLFMFRCIIVYSYLQIFISFNSYLYIFI